MSVEALIDDEVERTILGQVLAFPSALGMYLDAGLTREAFFRGKHGFVWEAIQSVDARGEVPDMTTVWLELKRRKTEDAIGAAHFGALIDGVPRPEPSNAQALTMRLTDLYSRRLLRESAQILEQEITDNPDAFSEGAVSRHLSTLERVLNAGAERRAHMAADGQLAALDADIARDRSGKVWLGFPALDEAMDGCRSGEVCGLMARPGIGKTLVLGHVARLTAESELPQVFFSLEMPAAQIVERLARGLYRMGRYELRDALEQGRLDRQRYTRVFRDLVIVDTPGLSVAEMAARLRTIQTAVFRDRPIRMVTIDHLGLIGGDRKMTTYDRVSLQARELKELAKRINATVLLAVQVNRDAGGDGSKELGLGAARDSGVVEEAMDYLVALRRLDQSTTLSPMERERYRDCLFAKVTKNRHGMTGREVGIRLDVKTLTLTEDATVQPEQNDLARIAAGGRR